MKKPITGFDGYYISDDGTVFSTLNKGCKYIDNGLQSAVMFKVKPRTARNGYDRVYMRSTENNKRVDRYIHRLVAEHFIQNPDNKEYVNHKNCIRNDNRVSNLEWCTAKENTEQTASVGHILRDERGKFVSNFNYEIHRI